MQVQVINEKFNKKLSIFYHPFFQDLIDIWSNTYSPSKNNINMMTFIELNLKIQKAIIPAFDFQNSLNSALTDWYKELDDLSIKNYKKTPTLLKLLPIKLNLNHITEALDNLPFSATVSNDKYISYFKANKTHVSLKYADTQLSLIGFAKFLFDLCVSWCENLDIELFILFLSGLFLQITAGSSINNSSLLKTENIIPLNQIFLNQTKMFKTHYERYKKQDLSSFQIWYEWNYLPSRLQEITKRVIDTLKPIYPNEESTRLEDLAILFDNIMKKSNFDASSTAEGFLSQLKFLGQLTFHDNTIINDKDKYGNSLILGENGFELSNLDFSSDSHVNIESNSNKHTKVVKKLCMPIFGKSVAKQQIENSKPHVHTINNHSLFLDNETNDVNLGIDSIYTGLYPIWEKKELSDCPSGDTLKDQKESLRKGLSFSHTASNAVLMTASSHQQSHHTITTIRQSEGKETPDLSPKFSKFKMIDSIAEEEKFNQKSQSFNMFNENYNIKKLRHNIASNLANKSLLDHAISFQDNEITFENHEEKNNPNRKSSEESIDEYDDIKNLIYNRSENYDSKILKPIMKIGPSFLNKNTNIMSIQNSKNRKFLRPSLSVQRDRDKEKEKQEKVKERREKEKFKENEKDDSLLDHSFKLDLSYRYETPMPSKNQIPFHNRKIILTANAKNNIMASGSSSQKNTTPKKNQDLESLAIIVKKDNDGNNYDLEKTSSPGISNGNGEPFLHADKIMLINRQRKKSYSGVPIQKFDFSSYENLFPDGLQNFEIDKVKTEKDYLKKIENIKKAYNRQFKSEFLKTSEPKVDYPSSRHEMGGIITDAERNEFLRRVGKKWEVRIERHENRKNMGIWGSGRRLKALDNPKIVKTFMNSENKTLFKEIMTIPQI